MDRIKVLIVDDEYLERTLIKLGTDWVKNSFDIIGEADSGEAALQIIESSKPDIVFTDICMPFMDGLELTQKIRENYSNIKIVIITGHRDFEYAQKAVKYGVTDFLLKPINSEEILKTALNLKKIIEEERKIDQEYSLLKNQVKESNSILKQKFLKKLIFGQINYDETYPKLMSYNLNCLADENLCISIRVSEDKKLDIDEALKAALSEIKDYESCLTSDNELTIIFSFVQDIHQYDIIYEKLMKELKDKLRCEVTIGVGNVHKGIKGMQLSYKEAVEAIKARVIYDKNQVIFYKYIKTGKIDIKDIYDIDWKELTFYIKNGLKEKSIDFINKYISKLAESRNIDVDAVRVASANIISIIITILSDMGKKISSAAVEDSDIYNKISKIDTLKDMRLVLIEFIDKIMNLTNSSNSRKTNELVEKVKLFIEENYSDPNLNLTDIASKFYVNQSYLSRVFKAESNEGISDYIGKLRINKSIEYLKKTNLKAYEIAEKVGICDPHYFSICFKKYTGKSVNEYKKQLI